MGGHLILPGSTEAKVKMKEIGAWLKEWRLRRSTGTFGSEQMDGDTVKRIERPPMPTTCPTVEMEGKEISGVLELRCSSHRMQSANGNARIQAR